MGGTPQDKEDNPKVKDQERAAAKGEENQYPVLGPARRTFSDIFMHAPFEKAKGKIRRHSRQ